MFYGVDSFWKEGDSMKKIMSWFFAACFMVSVSGCVDHTEKISQETLITEENEIESGNVLVAYFSWADNALLDQDVDTISSPSVVAPGNVEQLAGWVQEQTGGDLFSIQVSDPYPSDWDACLERANIERGQDARPELAENVENVDSYDVVFLGYPNWWYGVPMAVLSFLENNDLSGKTVYLFCSHGTGGVARSVDMIKQAVPNANISESIFDCYEEETSSSKQAIQDWVKKLEVKNTMETNHISVQYQGQEILYELNDSLAAKALLEQLPLTVEIEDFSTNEKIFYPPEGLDVSDAPLASGGSGILAYYAPWKDIVMFYDDFDSNGSLYELGKIVSGENVILQLEGMVTISKVEDNGQ